MTIQVAIYGAGGFGREVAWLVESCNRPEPRYHIVSFVDDDPSLHGREFNGIPVAGLDEVRERYPSIQLVRGLGSIGASEKVAAKAASAGLRFATVIHPGTERSRYVAIGEGTVICAGNILTTNITIGRCVQINLGCTIGHDAVLGDFTTLAPGVHVSGYVHIGSRVYIGTGAVIINGTEEHPLVIGDGAVIGAGACVIRPVEPDARVAGVPARSI